MKSRLAFSIACLVNPDILILDEVLSVGDGAFRQKSAARMQHILENGVTGILVSHSIKQIREICNKILWMDHGKQVGFSDKVQLYCDAYEEFLDCKKLPQSEEEILQLAINMGIRKERSRIEKNLNSTEKIKAYLEKDKTGAAVEAAHLFLQKHQPGLLQQGK